MARSEPDRNSSKALILCKCPMCEDEHYRLIFWTGQGMPRMYCEDCRQNMTYQTKVSYDPFTDDNTNIIQPRISTKGAS